MKLFWTVTTRILRYQTPSLPMKSLQSPTVRIAKNANLGIILRRDLILKTKPQLGDLSSNHQVAVFHKQVGQSSPRPQFLEADGFTLYIDLN